MSPTAPFVSLVMPTLNAERYLAECLEALTSQRYPRDRLEILMPDGGSTDGTLDIAARFGARVLDNPLRTGEAGKAVGAKVAQGELLLFVDSDNIVVGSDWLERMVEPFEDPEVIGVEAMRWDYRRQDHYINRWHALTGVADPLTLYVGNYCRESLLTGRWTDYPHASDRRGRWEKVRLDPRAVPVFGANGFVLRRQALDIVPVGDYLFDLDYVRELIVLGHDAIGRADVAVRHYFCDGLSRFQRKTRRRADDFFFFKSRGQRSYPWTDRQRRGMVRFVVETLTVVPLLARVAAGFRRRPDPAWLFHVPACWITLVTYAFGVIRGRVRPRALDREGWSQ